MKHCCKDMNFFLEENKIDLVYRPHHRSYSLGLKNNSLAIQNIYYCPWCGSKLPSNLKKTWLKTLRSMGYEDPFEDDIPEEFKTDEWWKKRNL